MLVAYGGDANTIMSTYGKTKEEAEKIYNSYMEGLIGVQKYQKFCRMDVMEKGYILLNPKTKYKAFIYDYPRLKKYWESFQENGFWDYYRSLKQSDPTSYTVQKVKTFFKRKAASEKQAINYRIQHSGAACIKVAMIKFFKYLRENNLLNIVKLCVLPYDECNVEAPKEIAEEVTSNLYRCMIEAGAYFCTRCKLDAEISRLPDGSLPTYWIH